MSELKVFVDVNENTTGKVVVCQENATKLGVSNGASVEVENPDNGKKISGTVEISNMVLDFAAQISRNIVDILEFSGVELIIRPASQTGLAAPTQMPKVPISAPQPQPQTQPGLTPLPAPPPQVMPPIPQPTPPSKVQQISTPTPQPTYTPTPQPKSVPQPPVPTPTP
ncbi:MAG: hypothetical protein ACFFEO_05095, partial [Candidatus Thorarchaeota archaeon]